MANRFDIVISAVDRASKPMANINKSIGKMFRPLDKLNRSFKNLGKEMHFDKMMQGLTKTGKFAQAFGVGSPLIAGMAGGMGLAALMESVSKLVMGAGGYGRTISRLSQRTGAGARDLQRYRGAAQLMGLPSEAVDQGFTNLTDVARNAQFDPNIAMLLSKLGVRVKRGKDGLPDIADLMRQMAASAQVQQNPATAKAILDQLGLGDLFPLLRDGSKNLEDLAKKAEKLGIVMDDGAIKSMSDFDRSMSELKTNFDTLGRQVGAELAPAFKAMADWLNEKFESKANRSFMAGAVNPLNALPGGIGIGITGLYRHLTAAPVDRRVSGLIVDEAGNPVGADPKAPLGIRNNNPGNLRNPGGSGFQRFASMADGYRAMAGQLGLYYNRDGLDTINGVVRKWAPPSENNTSAYIQSVARQTGFKPDQHLNLNDPATLESLMKAMVTQEGNGKSLTAADIGKAVADALTNRTLKVAPQGGSSTQVAFAMPSDGAR